VPGKCRRHLMRSRRTLRDTTTGHSVNLGPADLGS
jgi:hypothetical protein